MGDVGCYHSLWIMAEDRDHASASQPELDPALEQESRFWGTATRLLLDSGVIPYDVDRRRAGTIRNREVLLKLGSRRADPQVEERWRGPFADRTLALLQEMRAKRVLELGCGAGWLALEMARQGLAVDAVDISEERIEIARRYYHERSRQETLAPVSYDVANLELYEPSAGVYDAVVSFTTLHHIHDKRGLIERCHQALPDGGRLIVFDDEHHAGPWPSRAFRGLAVLGLGLLFLLLPSPVPRRRRLLEAAYPLTEGMLSPRARERLRSLAAPLLWRGEAAATLSRGSPSEGVHDEHEHHASLPDLVASVFEEVRVERRESFGLRHLLVLDVPGPLRGALTRMLYSLDQTFAGSAWLPGAALYIVATKRTP